MPPYRKAASKAQRVAAAIAEHHPSELYKRNAAMKTMSMGDLHAMASTKTKSLPRHVKKSR